MKLNHLFHQKVDVNHLNCFDELIDNIIKNRDVKTTASHDNGKTFIQPSNLDSEIHIQIYFFNVSVYKQGYNDPYSLYNNIRYDSNKIRKIINTDKYNEPYYFGFSTKQEIINYKRENETKSIETTWTFSWTDRWYWKSPILKAHNMKKLIATINKYKNERK